MANYIRTFEEGHSYFITVVTYNRRPILIENIDLLRKSFALSRNKYNYTLDAIVILPDHFHMIITPQNSNEYPKIISHIKRSFLYGLNSEFREECKLALNYKQHTRQVSGVWQKRFYEHTIRNEKDLYLHRNYILNNPVKHEYVDDVKVWKYSSFYER